ncbi:UDP-4-amino-4,6-dideoxy-N-acetyl-beta-L-altrosamine transaminase [Maricaulis maris]|uniref:UDP-4-amino-4, 6-dideoxy-N-acetyl-beta-L-altrosamine transaminase n=1 Tax=Maricaulis maris TaxID=74318 RepID=A0A495DE31_9PROT|nr:UDP-4-amino-4,6-dideoxy-N-acetyl-beta-L-altrosamine transaminase [Maricaulis maris]RKR00165.1 UDP-4-amino-4,6-dideoxy-N-acetyl-beta-L-altrosamine transaminase [Maricaulis maris]
MAQHFLPYGRQSIDESDIEAVVEVLRGDWLTTGPTIDALEAAFCDAVGAAHAVACSNGTTALHLALAAEGVGPGDVCIVPAVTFMATANAAIYCGAEVVFADVDPDTGLMTPNTLADALRRAGGKARAVLPVHLAGQCEALDVMAERAAAAGAVLIEDACHAVGSRWQGQPVGNCTHSRAATFSFHPVKTIAAGEGGMVTTHDAALARRMRVLRSHGIERDPSRHERRAGEPWWHEMQMLGWNYRLSDIQAALALSQLKRLGDFTARRGALAQAYDAALAGTKLPVSPLARTADCEPCLHLYPVRITFEAAGVSRADVMAALAARGVGSQVHYIPVPDQPWYKARHGEQELPGARHYYEHTLSLPLYVGMSDDDPGFVVEMLAEVLGG